MAKWLAAAMLLPITACLAVFLTYCTVPNHSNAATHFDTLIVLGCPPDPDGKPSSEQRARAEEAVQEFRAGRADHIILTGGSRNSKRPEAEVMGPLILADGIPTKDLVIETEARNTIENIFYSNEIMRQHGWKSAEIVSSPSHLPRTALILEHYQIGWRTRAAKWPPEYSRERIGSRYLREALGTTALRWFGFRQSAFLPVGSLQVVTMF